LGTAEKMTDVLSLILGTAIHIT